MSKICTPYHLVRMASPFLFDDLPFDVEVEVFVFLTSKRDH